MFYAFMPIFTRLVYRAEDIAPLDVSTGRFLVAVITVFLLLFITGEYRKLKQLTQNQFLILVLLGVIFSVPAILAAFTLQHIPAPIFILLVYTYPAMVAIFSMLLGEHLPPVKWMAIGLAFIGCALAVSKPVEVENPSYLIVPIITAAAIAVYIVALGRYNTVSGLPSGAVIIASTLVVMLLIDLVRGVHLPTSTDGILALIGLGSISTGLAMVLLIMGVNYIGATNASILDSFQPVMVVILAAVVLDESIHGLQVFGGVLVIFSVILLNLPPQITARFVPAPRQNRPIKS